MPYKIVKVPHKNCFKVYSIDSGRVHAKCSTLENAKRQVRLLHMKTGH